MKIPKTLKVGGNIYKIVFPYNFTERYDRNGDCDSDILQIRIADSFDKERRFPREKIEQIFIHELLHAISYTYNADKLEEEPLTRLAEGLYQVLKDNDLIE